MLLSIILCLKTAVAALAAIITWAIYRSLERYRAAVSKSFPTPEELTQSDEPLSVNYHFTRKCNMSCGFCFHTATSSYIKSIDEAKKGILLLKQAGMRKINFAGGEPFLYAKFLGQLVDYCKEIGVESVSIVSNGSKITKKWISEHGKNVDIMAVSCDSFNEETNIAIGRGTGSNVQQLHNVKHWCDEYGVMFKLNTVVCQLNWEEDMNEQVAALAPSRWKVFQVLIVEGENESKERLRDATKYTIDSEMFEYFVMNHKDQKSLIAEPNHLMAKSYLILDEHMRFLDRDGRQPSKSILEVGVKEALRSVYWDTESFIGRGGIYDWTSHGEEKPLDISMEW